MLPGTYSCSVVYVVTVHRDKLLSPFRIPAMEEMSIETTVGHFSQLNMMMIILSARVVCCKGSLFCYQA